MVYQEKKKKKNQIHRIYCRSTNLCLSAWKNLQYLATEIYTVKSGLSPEIKKKVYIFKENENYDRKSGVNLAKIICIKRNMALAL